MSRVETRANGQQASARETASAPCASRRPPRGYRGLDHITLGSDVLALLEAILSPELILGTEAIAVIRGVQPRRSMRMPHSLSRPQMHRFGVADVMLDAFDLVGDRFERTHRLGDVVPS